MADSLQPHGRQHARLLRPLSPRVCSNACSLSWWCYRMISSSATPFSFYLQSFPAPGFFSNESALLIRWPKYWIFRFSISLSNEHPGLISFRMDWFDLLAVQGTLKSLQYHLLFLKSLGSETQQLTVIWTHISFMCVWIFSCFKALVYC